MGEILKTIFVEHMTTVKVEFILAHQTHSAYEGKKTAGYENTGHNITGNFSFKFG